MFLMFQTIYLKKWTDNFPTAEILEMAMQQWSKGLAGLSAQSIEKVVDYCRINLQWPPSIAEFISLCEKEEGIPDWETAMNASIRGDFYHPLIAAAYNEVGSWSMSRDSKKEVDKKFKEAYRRKLEEYRLSKNLLRLEEHAK